MRKFLLLLTLFLISSCEITIGSFSNFSESQLIFKEERKTMVWKDLLSQQEENYYAYIYSETCGYCKKIEPEIKSFALKHVVYFVLFSEGIPIKPEREDFTNVDDINSLFILGTPTLFKISSKKVDNCYIGFYEIQGHIKEVA